VTEPNVLVDCCGISMVLVLVDYKSSIQFEESIQDILTIVGKVWLVICQRRPDSYRLPRNFIVLFIILMARRFSYPTKYFAPSRASYVSTSRKRSKVMARSW
jgi:hypothetical protein